MERDAEEPDNNETSMLWSGSDCSQEHCVSESLAESYYEDDTSDAEYRSDPRPARIAAEKKSPGLYQNEERKSTGDQEQLPGLNGSEAEVLYQGEDEEDDFYLSDSREILLESPHVQTSPPVSPHSKRPDSEQEASKISETRSSSLSLGCAANVTQALTPTRGQTHKASSRRCPGTLKTGVDSSEEGGSHEAPPASVFFGMSDEGAEQAETWNSESDTDLCRLDRQRLRNTCISHNESQSERQAKENKSKCKKIARLLTDAPNPRNKGALLFNKRRQRVEKYTLVSYGTGGNRHASQDQIEEEVEEIRSARYGFVETTDSEFEEEYCVHHRQQDFGPNWESLRDMEALPDTKGKGVLMFAKCRQRVDEVVSAHEQLRNKGMCEGKLIAQNMYDAQRSYYPAENVGVNIGQQVEYQEHLQQVNHLSSNMSRALVSNRTAKPFPGFQDSRPAAVGFSIAVPLTKKHELKFKVPVLTNTNPQVWSPTGDVIASRDERISVPAIKTGILPEFKRRVGSKQSSTVGQGKQNKGQSRSFIDAEEDCFSLGAEACNFMQPRRVKLKNPPPVAPKPAINPACPPVMRRSPLSEPYIPARSPVSQPRQMSVRAHSQQHLHQRDWEPAQGSHTGPGLALLQPTRKNRGQQPPQSAGLVRRLPKHQQVRPSGTPESIPGIYSSQFSRQKSVQEKVYKPLTPWEAASRSPIGSVDEAFVLQDQPLSVASSLVLAGQHKSLPEPPEEWKRRVSLEPAAVGVGRYPAAPAFQAPSLSQTFSQEKRSFYGPPFRPAQPLNLTGRPSAAYMGQPSNASKYSPLHGAIH